MAKLTQEDFNKVADYYYAQQRDETACQSNRMMWIIAAQALVFTGVCTLIGSSQCYNTNECIDDILLPLLMIVGVFIAVSAVYSSLISEISIGAVLSDWNYYDSLSIERKPDPVKHKIIVAPNEILNSKLNWLAFHTFAPKVFLAAWIVLILYMICGAQMKYQPIYVLTYLAISLVMVHVLIHLYKSLIQIRISQRSYLNNDNNTTQTHHNYPNNYCCNMHRCAKYGCDWFCCSPVHFGCCNKINKFANPTISYEKLSIYHIMIDRFNGGWTTAPKSINDFVGGNLKGIIEKFGYIKSQGYNAIMLTPIYKSVSYHGYHIIDYEKVDDHFGNWDIFRMLVIQAHQLGLKVICDFVPNHCHEQHPFFQNALKKGEKRAWFYFEEDNSYAHFEKYEELPKFNLKNQDAANYLITIAKKLSLCGIDGIRIDHAIGVPFDFLKSLRTAIKEVNPMIIVFGEVVPGDSKYVARAEFKTIQRREQMVNKKINQDELQLDYSDTLDGVLDFVYKDIIIHELRNGHNISTTNLGLMSKLSNHFNKYTKGFMPIIFLDNHDVNRIMFYCNGNRSLLDEIVNFTRNLNVPHCIYYGTEQYMCNQNSLESDIPNVDLEVREPMDWN